jgi:DNA-binding transcriptional ArsR family regulator
MGADASAAERYAKAIAHPKRLEILAILEARQASPNEIAGELGAALSLVSYHVRKLRELGLIELANTTPRRGAVEHYYRAIPPTANGDGDAGALQRASLMLDERGHEELATEVARFMARLTNLNAAAARRQSNDRQAVGVAVVTLPALPAPPDRQSPNTIPERIVSILETGGEYSVADLATHLQVAKGSVHGAMRQLLATGRARKLPHRRPVPGSPGHVLYAAPDAGASRSRRPRAAKRS